MMLDTAVTFITSFLAAATFGIMYNVPKKSVWAGGLVGMIGWVIYKELGSDDRLDVVFATVVASFVVAMTSQFFARMYKMPIIVFSISGIIPLVPGGLSYNAMRNFVVNDYEKAIEFASKAFMISGAIAFGLLVAGVLIQIVTKHSSPSVR